MGSVSSVNPGVADLLQTLSNENSPVLSNKAAVSALESASPSDIVQLSVAASQLEGIDVMFGLSNSTGTSTTMTDMENLLAAAEPQAPATSAASTSTATTTTSASQLANDQATLQAVETQALFGGGASGLTNSVFNMIG